MHSVRTMQNAQCMHNAKCTVFNVKCTVYNAILRWQKCSRIINCTSAGNQEGFMAVHCSTRSAAANWLQYEEKSIVEQALKAEQM